MLKADPRHWALLLLLLTLVACAAKPAPPPAPPVLVPEPACDQQCIEGLKKATVQMLEDLRMIRNIMIYQLNMQSPEGIGVRPEA